MSALRFTRFERGGTEPADPDDLAIFEAEADRFQVPGFNLWCELRANGFWYVVDAEGEILSPPQPSAQHARAEASDMTNTRGT